MPDGGRAGVLMGMAGADNKPAPLRAPPNEQTLRILGTLSAEHYRPSVAAPPRVVPEYGTHASGFLPGESGREPVVSHEYGTSWDPLLPGEPRHAFAPSSLGVRTTIRGAQPLFETVSTSNDSSSSSTFEVVGSVGSDDANSLSFSPPRRRELAQMAPIGTPPLGGWMQVTTGKRNSPPSRLPPAGAEQLGFVAEQRSSDGSSSIMAWGKMASQSRPSVEPPVFDENFGMKQPVQSNRSGARSPLALAGRGRPPGMNSTTPEPRTPLDSPGMWRDLTITQSMGLAHHQYGEYQGDKEHDPVVPVVRPIIQGQAPQRDGRTNMASPPSFAMPIPIPSAASQGQISAFAPFLAAELSSAQTGYHGQGPWAADETVGLSSDRHSNPTMNANQLGRTNAGGSAGLDMSVLASENGHNAMLNTLAMHYQQLQMMNMPVGSNSTTQADLGNVLNSLTVPPTGSGTHHGFDGPIDPEATGASAFGPYFNWLEMMLSAAPSMTLDSFTAASAVAAADVYFGRSTITSSLSNVSYANFNESEEQYGPPDLDGSVEFYNVQFKAGRSGLYYVRDPKEMSFQLGNLVIVEADRGRDLGRIVGSAWPVGLPGKGIEYADREAKPICRGAFAAEVLQLSSKLEDERRALNLCQTKIRQKKLPMEVVEAEYQWDRRKLTYYFIADRRIDFRELVRELFKVYKTRIWMCSVDETEGRRLGPVPAKLS